MKKGIAKFTAFCLAAGMTLGEGGAVYFAAPATTMVGVGSDNLKNTETKAEKAQAQVPETEAQAQETEAETQAPETEAVDRSMVGTTGFAQCSEYVNVRSSADTEGSVVGKIYANGSVEILDVDEYGWYHIRSGNVEGYVAGQYIATGAQAASIASSTGYTTAEVGAEVLNVRASANGDSDIIATLTNAQEIEVVADEGEWVKVALDSDTYGYVSHDYVNTSTSYATGETIEEEQARLDAQWTAYVAQQEAAQAASQSYEDTSATDTTSYSEPVYEDTSYSENTYTEDTSSQNTTYTEPVYTDSSDLASQASALYQTYLNAQAAADAAVANGADEQTIIDTAAAAQSAYATYVAAQNAADAAAAGMTTDTSATTAQTTTDTSAQDAAAADAAAAAQAQAEADAAAAAQAQAEAEAAAAAQAQAEAEAAAAAQASSAGQSVANYATQFVGNPYVWGGASLTGGADCSGFTMAVYANFGVSLPHNAAAQSGCGTAVDMSNLQPGDLIFYGSGISHVAMYIGGGSVVHASNETNGIIISNYNYRSPVCARRYL